MKIGGGVTALFASSEYDRGDIIMQKSMYINYPIKIDKAIEQIKPLYAKLTCDIYSLIQGNHSAPNSNPNISLII